MVARKTKKYASVFIYLPSWGSIVGVKWTKNYIVGVYLRLYV
jgi:hypothetical protein